jgi:DNA-binding NarL/FixJ family response regulator
VEAAAGEGRCGVILVVDDEPAVANAARTLLIASGHSVPEVISTPAGLEKALETVRPDLVLMDIDLGDGISGIEVAGRVPPGIPVIFVSGHSDPETLKLAGASRPAGFVVKPFEAPQLRAAVEMALARGGEGAQAPKGLPDLPELATLSAREREVLEQLLGHRRAPAIAKALFISPHTVRNHLKKIFSKLNVRSQQELLDRITGPTSPGTGGPPPGRAP